jgi:hypothetical protein
MGAPPPCDQPNSRETRHSLRRRRRVVLGILVIAIVALIAAARPTFHWFKATRAAQLAATANSLADAGKLVDAADKFRAALQLDPVSYPALQGAARLASRVGRPEALDLWEQVVRTPRATVDDRQQYAEQLLLRGRPRMAATTIEALIKSAPNAKTFELASHYARSVGESAKAIEFARLAIKSTPNDQAARFHLAELLASSADTNERFEARKILWELSDTGGAYRQPAIEALAGAPELSESDRRRVLDVLRTLSPKNIRDALLAADLKLQSHMEDPPKIYDQVTAAWNHSNPSELVDLARWLNVHQQGERVLSLFPVDIALQNNQLLLVRLDALATLQRWNEIDTLLSRPDLTIDPSVLESFRARTAQEQNAALDAELHWNHAISFAGGDPLKLRAVADFAERSQAPAVALKVYEQLAKFPEHAAFAYRGTERLSAEAGDLAVRRAAAEKITTLAAGDPNAVAQLAYVNLLAGKDVESNTALARKLVKEHPDRLSFRVTAALGLLRQHDGGGALEQFKGPAGAPPIDWNKTPPAWRAVYAAVLLANDQVDAAREIIRSIPTKQLSAEERALIEAK